MLSKASTIICEKNMIKTTKKKPFSPELNPKSLIPIRLRQLSSRNIEWHIVFLKKNKKKKFS